MPAGLGAAAPVVGPIDWEGHFHSAPGLAGRNALDSPPMAQLPKGSCPALELISQLLGMGTIRVSQPVPGDPGQQWRVVEGVWPTQEGKPSLFPPSPLSTECPYQVSLCDRCCCQERPALP